MDEKLGPSPIHTDVKLGPSPIPMDEKLGPSPIHIGSANGGICSTTGASSDNMSHQSYDGDASFGALRPTASGNGESPRPQSKRYHP